MRALPKKSLTLVLAVLFLCSQQAITLAKSDPTELPKIPRKPAGPPEIPGAKALAELKEVQTKNSEMAVQHFSGLIEKDPKDSASYAARGRAYSSLGDYGKAKADLEKAIQLNPKTVEAYKGRAVLRYMEKDTKGAWEDVHKIEELGDSMWPSFMEGLKQSSAKKDGK